MFESQSEKKLLETLNVDPQSLKKTEEYFRIIRDKATGKYIGDCDKIILCLDLAAKHGGFSFNRDKAITLSGLKNQTYNNFLKLYEKFLNLETSLTLADACVQLGCSQIKDLAQQILSKYKENNEVDDDNPMYIAAVVSAACKIKRVKVAKTKFLEVSRLRAAQWKELEAKFQKHVDYFRSPPEKSHEMELSTEEVDVEEDITRLKAQVEDDGEEEEDYATWKARILSQARAALQAQD